jgi:hypothetical protein
MAKPKLPELRRATGWTAYERSGHIVIKADGEIVPIGHRYGRPATEAEIAEEVARRLERANLSERIGAFRARPEWQDADDIRSTIEVMDHNNHPLDRLTPEEWRALRFKICGPGNQA